MDCIGQECDLFRRDMDAENGEGSLLAQIDAWEQESIVRIKQAAEKARRDLRSMTEGRAKQELKSSMDGMSKEIQSSRDSEDYTEGDLTKWTNQLNQFRKDLEELARFSLIDEGNESSIIRLIKVKKNEYVRPSNANSRFTSYAQSSKDHESCNLLEDGQVVVASGLQPGNHMAFMGTGRYSVGSPWVRFQLEKLTGGAVLFGIIPFSHTDPASIFTSATGAYGWYAGSVPVKNNAFQEVAIEEYLRAGDQITLTLNCYSEEIVFRHHRTERLLRLSVDPQRCPLPWKILVVLYNNGDRVLIH